MLRSRVFLVLVTSIFGTVSGWVLAAIVPMPAGPKVPMPHHVPFAPGAASFRFAMVHDVLHQRFPKHGAAFYAERDRRARAKLAAVEPTSDAAIALHDDIAVGLDRIGKPVEAVEVIRRKQSLEAGRGITGLGTYATSANLGSFLIHAHMPKAMAGNADGRAGVNDGLQHLNDALKVNPHAHFGREKWQVAIIRFLRDVGGEPALLTKHDFIGNSLETKYRPEEFELRPPRIVGGWSFDGRLGPARPFTQQFATHTTTEFRHLLSQSRGDPTTLAPDDAANVRKEIVFVGPAVTPAIPHVLLPPGSGIPSVHPNAVPFDEPMLGVVGMWRQGDGANVHFALAIGETMLRVGQRELAWSGFERAKRLANGFSPNPDTVKFLRDHCDQRQAFIESTLPNGSCEGWRARFDAELAFGEHYQREMQEYETAKIAGGGDVYDPAFLDDFHTGRAPISTAPGEEEYVRLESPQSPLFWRLQMALATAVFAAGSALFFITRRHRKA